MEAIARRFVEAFNERDSEKFVSFADPEVDFHPTPLAHAEKLYHGHDGLRQWMEDIEGTGIGHSIHVKEVRTLDRSQFLILADVMVGGEPVSPFAILGKLGKARKVVEVRTFLSDARTLAQVGVTSSRADDGSLSEPA
jgi:SnoaL-like domain